MPVSETGGTLIFQLEVALKGIKPPTRRRLQVPSSLTLSHRSPSLHLQLHHLLWLYQQQPLFFGCQL